jgi:hypothetical protein
VPSVMLHLNRPAADIKDPEVEAKCVIRSRRFDSV